MIGNHGLANYSAANTFMASLARQRKERGFAASIIHIGAVHGAGYITRGPIFSESVIQSGELIDTSEPDVHQLFGKAILVGRPGLTSNIELILGVRKIRQEEEHPLVWQFWPRMRHFVLGRKRTRDSVLNGAHANISIKTKLAKASSGEQVYNIIWDVFAHQLNSLFQLAISEFSKEELGVMHFDQMGIDSLTAMKIRGWFMKNIEINIPVLKILMTALSTNW